MCVSVYGWLDYLVKRAFLKCFILLRTEGCAVKWVKFFGLNKKRKVCFCNIIKV